MSQLTWRIHSGLLNGREAELAVLLERLGDTAQFVDGPWRALPPPPPAPDGGLALTIIQDVRKLLGHWQATPGLYFDLHKYDVSYWMPRVAEAIPVLNRRCLFTPAGALTSIPLPFWTSGFPMSDGLIFIRPDSGLKLFPGLVIDCYASNARLWPAIAREFARAAPGVAPETMVCVAPGHQLNAVEWRFWVVDRRVVASTPYSWSEGLVPWQPPPAEALRTAQEMAENAWRPDIAYVVDVVQLAGGDQPFYLNEINAASTSGLYAVPFEPLVFALRDAVQRELAGDLTIED